MPTALRWRSWLSALAGAALSFTASLSAARAATPQQVGEAIERAKKYILSQQKGDNWEAVPRPSTDDDSDPNGAQWGGTTACAVYGLLAAGMNPKDPQVAPAIEWLKKAPIGGHYANGLRAQVWTFLKDPREAKVAALQDAKILQNALIKSGPDKGLYPYYTDLKTGKPQEDWADHSVSQISVLGVWACEQAGVEIPTSYWKSVDEKWKADQASNGGWTYKKDIDTGTTPSMTAAGVATLFITQDYVLQGNNWSHCTGGGIRNEHIERGLAWMDRNIAAILAGEGDNYFYTLYGIERMGVASGRKYFGTVDWYKVGADAVVKLQNRNGSFGEAGGDGNPKGIPSTVFATLFLVRGRAPIVMSKLQYGKAGSATDSGAGGNHAGTGGAAGKPRAAHPGPGGGGATGKDKLDPWNERPRDSANYVRWASHQLEQYLNYQIVNLQVASEELHDSPILYIAGSEPLNLSDDEITKLREFVEDGGLILGNSDCASAAFTASFIALGHKLFPRYEFRDLPATHAIYTEEQFAAVRWKVKPHVTGISNGVRELMLLAPELDMGRAWQTRSDKINETSYQLMQNIFLYAVEKKNLRYRGETYIVRPDRDAPSDTRIKLARIAAGDNPDPEPGGWRRLANILHNRYRVELTTESVRLGDGKLDPKVFKVAHLTGTTKLQLRDEQRKELKAYITGGGTLIVDAAGGSSAFADAVEVELPAVFGRDAGAVGSVMPADDGLYASPKIERFDYRLFAKAKLAGRLGLPRVRAMDVGGRRAVYYSREDLSAGLVGQQVDGILGYAPDTATDIMRNLVLRAGGVDASMFDSPHERSKLGSRRP